MTSVPIRDPLADHLITPQNAALIVIDYQQNQFRSVRSMDSDLLLDRLHRPPVDGMSRKSALMERSRTDHTRDPLCPVRSRPIKNNATAIQLSGLRLQR